MSLLDSASLICTPNGYKEGKLYSVIPSDGSGDMSVVRATTATRVNSAGLVELVPYNLIRRSEEFNLIWSPVRSSITANSTTAPNGTLTADTLIDDTNNNIHYIAQTFTAINGAATISVYAKANQISQIQLVAQQGTTPMGRGFDLATGTTFAESVGGVSSNDLGQSITDVGNGWYRCEMSWTSTGQNEFWILLSVSNAATFTGTGANGVYIYGAQLNEGSTAKDYQKTETRLNIPRLDYSNGTCPSLLVEPQRTNSCLWSEDFSNAAWIKLRLNVTANAITAPNGIATADKLIATAVNGDHTIFQTTTTGVAKTLSVYAKAGEYNYVFLGDNNDDNQGAFFNLSNGTISQNTSSYTAEIEDAGNGWYRCSVSTTSWVVGYAVICPSYNGTTVTFTGDGTSGIYTWGGQIENGSYATSYIPTTSASVTRNADVISKTGISSLIGQTEGTIFWDIYVDTPSATGHEDILNIDNGSFGNTIYFIKAANATFIAEMYVSSSQQATFTKTGVTAGRHKIAFAYANNNTAMFFDGVQVGSTDTSCSVPAMSRIQLGQGVFGPSTGFTNAAALWKTRLTNDQLEALTGTGFTTYADMANYYNYTIQ